MQPEHPEIDEEILQKGYAIMSNSSAAFYNRTKTRPPRSAELDTPIPCHSLSATALFATIFPLLVFVIFLVFKIRIYHVRK